MILRVKRVLKETEKNRERRKEERRMVGRRMCREKEGG